MTEKYVGHPSQLFGVEEHRLVGGMGDGMRLLEVNNGKGLMFTVSPDRCGDISRMYYKGINLGYFAPCGYVSPKYYDHISEAGFLKSFTAGFMTTCGLRNVGPACEAEGKIYPMHGNIANVPAERVSYFTDDNIYINLSVRDASLFGYKLILTRQYECRTDKNEITISDTVKNVDAKESPYMILYHFNLGYPFLCEKTNLSLNFNKVRPRYEKDKDRVEQAFISEKPQKDFTEECYFYDMKVGKAEAYNPDLKIKLSINYDIKELPCFTQWKMMGETEYVLGLEPGNCYPDGIIGTKEQGLLKYIKPQEEIHQIIKIKIEE